jgi:membrane-bound lytic murein transglycosylase D
LVLFLAAFGVAGGGGSLSAAQVVVTQSEVEAVPPHASAVSRLRTLIETAERSVEAEEWDTASSGADEAEILVADWSPEVLRRPDILPLIERLRVLQRQIQEESTPDDGLRMAEEIVALSPAELKAERDQVLAAEQGADFDFPIDLNAQVLAWVRSFTADKRGFVEGALSRATQYMPMIKQIFAEEGVPQDLAYLAVIESGFKNTARSRAKAVGMWQFIRSTGRMYGLNGNAWVEERRDPVKATRAAAKYLKKLYEREGDWYLALVGYNAGPLTTDRASQGLGSRNFWDMARSRVLRTETKQYVPKLCAAILVGRFPERYGLSLVQMRPYAFEAVEVDRMTSLPVLAKYAGTNVELLKELNPELLRASTPPGRYVLRVPPGTGSTTARALTRIPGGERVDFKGYAIRKGDTLAKVAARFKLSPEDLLAANGITKAQFKQGRRIKLPPPSSFPIDEIDLKPFAERAKVLAEQPLEPLPAIPGSPGTGGSGNTNSASTPPIQVAPEAGEPSGSLPSVPVPVRTKAPEPMAVTPTSPVSSVVGSGKPDTVRPRFHRVKRGETLFSISVRYGLELGDLRKWNKIKGGKLQIGQNLRLQKP